MDVPAFSKPPITKTKPQSNLTILLLFQGHLLGLGDSLGDSWDRTWEAMELGSGQPI